eukprot:COSAG03_NODE_526_length_7152_cov_8.927690_3_plen_91_part_00
MDGGHAHSTVMHHDGAECVSIATLANTQSTTGALAEAELIIKFSEPSEVQLKRRYNLSARPFIGSIRRTCTAISIIIVSIISITIVEYHA